MIFYVYVPRTVKKRLHMNNLATLMDEGCKMLREAYITEYVEEVA